MKRRDFLRSTSAASAIVAFPRAQRWFARGTPQDPWRTFEVTTRVEVLKPAGTTRIWVPAALVSETPYQRTLANTFAAGRGRAKLVQRGDDSLGIIAAEFRAGVTPIVT